MSTTGVKKSVIEDVAARVESRQPVQLDLPSGVHLAIDRGLPYLLVYRSPANSSDAGTARLLAGEAAVLTGASENHDLPRLVRRVAEAGSTTYGAFLVLEVWTGKPGSHAIVVRGPAGPAPETVEALVAGLDELAELHPSVEVRLDESEERSPPGAPPLLSIQDSWEQGVLYLGLEIPPIFRESDEGPVYPRFHQRLQRALSRALRRALYEFIRVQATFELENYRALGTRSVPDTIWRADRELAAIERSFSFLILTSPVNESEAWDRFRADRYQRDPQFHYRLLPVDPDLLKRRLFNVPLESIDDPALAYLMQDKREELDRQLSMLLERGSPAFRYSSMRLYGAVDDKLLALANELLRSVSAPPSGRASPREVWIDAEGFRKAAEAEFDRYARVHPPIRERRIDVRPDLTGLMVSEGNLLIGSRLRISPDRLDALIHHEIGTHVLTYVNGAAQPMEQLSLGLAGYDELQEGLAVLAEYLVNGLDRSRMRILAARVVAAHAVEQGASFVDAFGLLTGGHGYSSRGAWNVVTRVFSCGGFTRDLIYLRGLSRLLDHLREGGDLKSLYVGKIAQKHVPIIDELRAREVLRPVPLTPRFLNDPDAQERLTAVRSGIHTAALVRTESE